VAGAGSYKNKTLPLRESNEENSTQSRGVVAVPVVVKPVAAAYELKLQSDPAENAPNGAFLFKIIHQKHVYCPDG